MVFVETSFPRGGVVKTPTESAVATPDIEFGAATFKRKKEKLNKKQREEKHIHENEALQDKVEAVSAELLNLKTISEGMLVMGCISKIDATQVQVSLPGRLTGRVLVTAMAPSYVNIVNKYVQDVSNVEGYKSLEELFTIGQVVCVKVLQIEAGPNVPRPKIELSMNPAELQVDFQHNKIKPNTILVAAVEGIEDHGFVLDTGIPNLRAFMPTASAKRNDLGVGEVVFCKVNTSKPATAASTVICSALDVLDRKLSFSKDSPNLTHVLPTTIVKFKVTKQLKDGIQGLVLNDTFTAYVNEHQLETPLSSPEDYEIDSEVEARVLYVMPLTKLVYLSLNLCEVIVCPDDELKVGTIIEQARVLRIGTGGLVVRLNKRYKGLISFKSLRIGYNSNFDSDDLMAKYHKNSVHRIRITGFDAMDSLYVCSNDERLLAEKHFVPDDVEVGDYVDVQIDHKLEDGGYFVRTGQIKGYLEKVQVSSSTPENKLVDGGRLRCRVLRKNDKDQKIFLTNRKEFMASDALLLKSYTAAKVDQVYQGMISKIFADGYLVSFCQYVTGMLYKRNMNEADANAAAYYQVGQILKFRVVFVQSQHITLALSDFVVQTGTQMVAKVSTTSSSGLELTFSDKKFNGMVPPMLMTDFPSLSPAMYQTFRSGEPLDVLCVARNVYSIRDVERVRGQPIRHWDDVRVGDILPAYVKDVKGDVVELMCLIEDYTKVVRCHVKMLLEDHTRDTQLNLVAEQLLYIRVLGKNEMLRTLVVSTRLSHVWSGDLKETVAHAKRFFADVERIQKHFTKVKHPLSTFKAGDRVKGKVVDINAAQATVRLANNVTGVVSYSNTAEKFLETNAKLEFLVIWVDYVQTQVYLTAIPELVNRKIPKNDKNVKSQLTTALKLRADVLLVLNDVAILYPQKLTGRFIYVPTRFHHNDLQPLIMYEHTAGSVAHVTAISVDDKHIIGMFENIRKSFERLVPTSKANRLFRKKHQEMETNRAKLKADRKYNAELMRKHSSQSKYTKRHQTDKDSDEEESDDEVAVKLEYSGEAAFAAKQEDFDGAEIDTEQDLFFEDTLGGYSGGIDNIKKETNSKKRKNTDVTVHSAKKSLIKIEQLDGTADVADDGGSDEEFKGKASKGKTKNKRKNAKAVKPTIKLPGASNFWTADLAALNKKPDAQEASSSEDEDTATTSAPAKKVKLSTADRFRLARTEEARVRSVEETNANQYAAPSTVDHFERLVMATPNSSLAWINYMVFHMQSNEFHRARLVARKAFKKISFRDGEELLNVWLALLNLELRYGDKETFDAVLVEALQVNEPFKIYARCLQMLVSVSKVEELTDMILTFTKKFRSNPDCWTSAAAAFFEVGLPEKAKPLLNRALSSLPDRDHVSTIVKFASLNNKHDERDTAHALMEQILASYPKRVDCWSQYVDMLVKDKEISNARQILERGVSQKIPMKKMRTLFKKYLDFEEKFGDEESIRKVKTLAAQYVDAELKA